MHLFTVCPSCRAENKLKHREPTRPDLAKRIGEQVSVNCNHCGNNYQKAIGDVRAKQDYRLAIAAAVVGLILAVLLLRFGWVAVFPFLLPVLAMSQERNAVSAFNRYIYR